MQFYRVLAVITVLMFAGLAWGVVSSMRLRVLYDQARLVVFDQWTRETTVCLLPSPWERTSVGGPVKCYSEDLRD